MDALHYQFHQWSLQLYLQSLPDDVIEARAGPLLIIFNQEDHKPEEQHVLLLVVSEDIADYPNAHADEVKRDPCFEVVQVVGLMFPKH